MSTTFDYKKINLMPKKSVHPVSVRLPSEVKWAAEKAATDDQRSLSSLIQKVLADYLRKNGYLKK